MGVLKFRDVFTAWSLKGLAPTSERNLRSIEHHLNEVELRWLLTSPVRRDGNSGEPRASHWPNRQQPTPAMKVDRCPPDGGGCQTDSNRLQPPVTQPARGRANRQDLTPPQRMASSLSRTDTN